MIHTLFNKKNIATVFLLFFAAALFAQQSTWTVPEDKKSVKNPIKVTQQSIDKGETVYQKNCKACHGDPGMGNVINLNPPPKDVASDIFQANTDGELFYKMSTGRSPMPTFNTVIPDADKWNLINYLRKFKSGQAEEVIKIKDIKLTLTFTDSSKTILAYVSGVNEKNETVPVAGAEVGFYVKRYFGQLSLAKEKIRTNTMGYARVDFPKDLPGDTAGNVEFTAKLVNAKVFGKTEQTQTLKWGVPTHPKNILDGGHLWGNRLHAPIWLVALYLSVVGGIWGFIMYIGFLVFKIWKAGRIAKPNN